MQIVAGIVFFACRHRRVHDLRRAALGGVDGLHADHHPRRRRRARADPRLLAREIGGFVALVHEHPQKFQVFLPVTHEKFPFTGVFTGFLTVGIWYTCTSQHMVQRVLAAKDEWHARMGVIGAGSCTSSRRSSSCFPGMLAFKLLGPNLKPADSAYLTLVQQLVWPGLRGLILAAMAAALMSNLSAVLNSASTLVTIDFYKKLINPECDRRSSRSASASSPASSSWRRAR